MIKLLINYFALFSAEGRYDNVAYIVHVILSGRGLTLTSESDVKSDSLH